MNMQSATPVAMPPPLPRPPPPALAIAFSSLATLSNVRPAHPLALGLIDVRGGEAVAAVVGRRAPLYFLCYYPPQ